MKKGVLFSTIAGIILLFSGDLYALPITGGLVAAYTFDSNAKDITGNGNNGVVQGATLTTDRFGNSNSAYSFDGNGDYIEVANSSSLNFGTNDFSFSLWANIDSTISIQGGEVNLLKKFNRNVGYALNVRDFGPWWGTPGGHGRPYATIGNNKHLFSNPSNLDLRDNSWHMLSFVRSGDLGSLYLDGLLSASTGGFGGQNASSGTTSLIFGEKYTAPNGEFLGKLDDIFLFNRALSAGEINNLYNAEPVVSVPAPATILVLSTGLTGFMCTRIRRRKVC